MRRLCRGIVLAAGIAILVPAAALADDQEIAQKVASNLRTSGRMKDYNVGVKVQEGTAWLNGTVANQDQMRTALWIAQQSQGIERVVNNLTVAPAASSDESASGLRQPGSLAGNRNSSTPSAAKAQPQSNVTPSAVRSAALESPETSSAANHSGSYDAARSMPVAPASMPIAHPGAGGHPMAHRAMPPMGAPRPLPVGASQVPYVPAGAAPEMIGAPRPMPAYSPAGPGAPAPYQFDHPQMPGYSWPSYAAYPNYAAVTYPKQYSPTAWPYIGPFYPYPQVPLGWRKVTLEWDDGWWFLDFKDSH